MSDHDLAQCVRKATYCVSADRPAGPAGKLSSIRCAIFGGAGGGGPLGREMEAKGNQGCRRTSVVPSCSRTTRDQVFFRRNLSSKNALSPSLNIAQTISVRQSLIRYRGSLINPGTER